MMMCNFKMKKGLMMAGLAVGSAASVVPIIGSEVGKTLSKAAVSYAVKSEPEVYAAYTAVTGTPYDGTDYSYAEYFPQVLSDLGLGRWEMAWEDEGDIGGAVKDACAAGAPCIVQIEWDDLGRHFVVVDETHGFFGTTYGCMNDPQDGHVHLTSLGSGVVPYSPGYNKGKLTGLIVRRK